MFTNIKPHYPLILFILFSLRLIIKGSDLGEALALGVLASLYGYTLYLAHNKEKPINESIHTEIDNLKNTVNALKIAKSVGRF